MKGRFNLKEKFEKAGAEACFISEITLAELKYGVECSAYYEKNKKALTDFLTGVRILPIFQTIDTFAIEKARLRKAGTLVDDFDLLIGSTSVFYGLIMVTNNTTHLGKINGIVIEDWTK